MYRLEQARAEQDARRREARELAVAGTVQQAFDELTAVIYRKDFEAGDSEKLLRCLVLCAGRPAPSWAEKARARALEEWKLALAAPRGPRSEPPTFDQFLLGERRGRHSEVDRLRQLVIVHGVELARDYGIRGDRIFEFASACLYEYRHISNKVSYSKADAVKAIYFRLKKGTKAPRDIQIRIELEGLMASRLDEFPAGRAPSRKLSSRY